MKVKIVLMIFLLLVLSGGGIVLAHGSGQSGNSMAGMNMSGSSQDNNMAGMNMGGDKPIKEAPPNAKVLGTYGAVNAAFIIIGVWNKWFRRKDGSNVGSEK